jgi:hypothetical protein
MAEALDLRGALEQDRLQVMELLESTRRLVLEVHAAHYWTVEALASFAQLSKIGGNIQQMLDDLEPQWANGKSVFNNVEAVKLYKSAIGLWAALRPVRQKFAEHLDKRRRQRIMGEDYVEAAEVTQEQIDADLAEFSEKHAQLWAQYSDIGEAIQAIPAGLLPNGEQIRAAAEAAKHAPPPEAKPAADGTMPPPPVIQGAMQPPPDNDTSLSGHSENGTSAAGSGGRWPGDGGGGAQASQMEYAEAKPAVPQPEALPYVAEVAAVLDSHSQLDTEVLPQGGLELDSPLPEEAEAQAEVSPGPVWTHLEDSGISVSGPAANGSPASAGGGSAQVSPPQPTPARRPIQDYRGNGPRITWGGKD